jgi:hypothetical protein
MNKKWNLKWCIYIVNKIYDKKIST